MKCTIFIVATLLVACQQRTNSAKLAEETLEPGPETKTTKLTNDALGNGATVTWTRNSSNPKLGEAWSDPSGLIWGDIVKKSDGEPWQLASNEFATQYCADIGARLPTLREFMALRFYMGANANDSNNPDSSFSGYNPQVLPNLDARTQDHPLRNYRFWSQTPVGGWPLWYTFNGSSGVFNSDGGTSVGASYSYWKTFRCVMNPPTK